MAKSRLHELAARGQSVWFDTLSRDLVESGELKKMMDEDAVTGVTSNPTIFQKALVGGRRLRRAAEGAARDRRTTRRRSSSRSRSRTSATPATCCGPPTTSRAAIDGYVSMEVEPGIAYDTEKTFDQARWIATEVDRAEPDT